MSVLEQAGLRLLLCLDPETAHGLALKALAVGYFLFAEVPTAPMLWGAALVVSAGLFIIWREHRLGLERGKARRIITPQG